VDYLRYSPRFWLVELRKIKKTSARIANLCTEIRSLYLSNTKQKKQSLNGCSATSVQMQNMKVHLSS